jgi:hypothetical protein
MLTKRCHLSRDNEPGILPNSELLGSLEAEEKLANIEVVLVEHLISLSMS